MKIPMPSVEKMTRFQCLMWWLLCVMVTLLAMVGFCFTVLLISYGPRMLSWVEESIYLLSCACVGLLFWLTWRCWRVLFPAAPIDKDRPARRADQSIN